jgi:hypothetical protein
MTATAASQRHCTACGGFLPRTATAAHGCCQACQKKKRCEVCNLPAAAPGQRWCRECRCGYALASRILLSFQDRRTPARDAIVRENIKRYRKRASRGLPIFGGP